MKHYAILLFICLLVAQGSPAQGFDRDHKLLSVTGSLNHFIYLGIPITYSNGTTYNWMGLFSVQLKVEVEYPIHKYLDLGYFTGVGLSAGTLSGGEGPVVNVPIVGVFNFHYYQLIADRSKKQRKNDNLDLYMGVSAGTGIGVFIPRRKVAALVAVGIFQTGICYYVKPNIGIRGEMSIGLGNTHISAGVTFKMSRKKKQ